MARPAPARGRPPAGSAASAAGGAAEPVPPAMAKSWRPYDACAADLGGAAVYWHDTPFPDPGIGGELMCSTLVQGTPSDVLAALTHPSSASSLLGPARDVTVLQQGDNWKIVAMVLQPAPGSAAALVCAPRCAVVRVTRTRRPDGIHLLLFSSLPRQEARRLLASAPTALDGGGGGLLGAAWWAPVLAEVSGGYSVVGLQRRTDPGGPGGGGGGGGAANSGSGGAHATESMVTGIIRFDLGGWLSGGPCEAALAPAAAAAGGAGRGWRGTLASAFIDRALLAVPLAKREVELGRPRAYPPPPAAHPAAAAPSPPLQRPGSGLGMVQGLCTLLRRASSAAGGELAGLARMSCRGGSAAAGAPAGSRRQSVVAEGAGGGLRGCLDPRTWHELHRGGADAPFRVRGPLYLEDRAKIPAGPPEFELRAIDLVTTQDSLYHISRFLRCVRESPAAFSIVVDMMVPSTPPEVIHCVMVFSADKWHPSRLGPGRAAGPEGAAARATWRPFEHAVDRFLAADDAERSNMLKMIPHVERGSWVLKQTVGTTPVIMGRKLSTTYHLTDRYMEVGIDVASCKTAGYIVNMVRGVTTSLAVDLSYLLEGQRPEELPESLIGAVRLDGIDLSTAQPLDTSRELPLRPWKP